MKRHITNEGDRSGYLVVNSLVEDRSKGRRPKWTAICTCEKCGRTGYRILPYNFRKQKSCGCDRKWNPPPSGCDSKLFKGYKGMPSYHLSKAKARAKTKKLPCSVTQEYLWELYQQQNRKCALSGFDIYFPIKNSEKSTSTASLDRIDSSLGYEEGNVQWVHKDVNFMKNTLSQTRIIEICKAIASNS
jgi:hypothetical protein